MSGARRLLAAALVMGGLAFALTGASSKTGAKAPALHTGAMPNATIQALLHSKIKHVFVIYQENHSFDSEFGTYPGADGVYSDAARAHGFTQKNPVDGTDVTPFRITDPDVADVDHTRQTLVKKMSGGRMDRFVETEAAIYQGRGASPAMAAGMGDSTMLHIDCDAIPYLWTYAHRFTLFDRFFQGMTGPSTPGNIEIIAGQTGLTQAARHPEQVADPDDRGPGVPVVNDLFPNYGPFNVSRPYAHRQVDLTFVNVLLELEQRDALAVVNDNYDLRQDESAIAKAQADPVGWAWYQEGYADPNDPKHLTYITHHNAPQYFGYVMTNRTMLRHLADLRQFETDLQEGRLPDRGLFFVKGGFKNILGLEPANPQLRALGAFRGDDDHPAYSDQQISEALVAHMVNAIARSRYWKDSAIIITWDDSEGYWDHVPPPVFEQCPDAAPCGDGPRVPAIVISPFAKSGAIVHEMDDTASVPKFVETVFGLPAMASLPDEKPYLPRGPRDGDPRIGDLSGAFDLGRLQGKRQPLPASAALIPESVVMSIPSPWNCAKIGIAPVPPPAGTSDAPPAGYSPRPK